MMKELENKAKAIQMRLDKVEAGLKVLAEKRFIGQIGIARCGNNWGLKSGETVKIVTVQRCLDPFTGDPSYCGTVRRLSGQIEMWSSFDNLRGVK